MKQIDREKLLAWLAETRLYYRKLSGEYFEGVERAYECIRDEIIEGNFDKEETQDNLRELLHDLAFFQFRVDSRLDPQYESGWNDAVTAITKKARDYFEAQGIAADTPIEETS